MWEAARKALAKLLPFPKGGLQGPLQGDERLRGDDPHDRSAAAEFLPKTREDAEVLSKKD